MIDYKQQKLCKAYEMVINDRFYSEIVQNRNLACFDKLYEFLISISPSIYNYKKEKMNSSYKLIKQALKRIEKEFQEEYIISSSPIIRESQNELDQIIEETRQYLYEENAYYDEDKKSIVSYEQLMNTLSFVNQCGKASRKVKELCNKRGIKCRVVTIYPGYDKEAKLYGQTGFHSFNIAKYKGEYYIIDCTYRQFFSIAGNHFERVGIVDSSGCKSGFFATQDKTRKKQAEELIEKGYIKIQVETLKQYLDPFTLSYRNGIYYEKTEDYSFQTEYTNYDYEKFLLGKDSQTRYESREFLGYLKRPVKF